MPQVCRASTIGAAYSRCSTQACGVDGSTIGRITNLVVPIATNLSMVAISASHPCGTSTVGIGEVGSAFGQQIDDRLRHGSRRVGDQRAVVILVDGAVVLGQRCLDRLAASGRVVGSHEARQPAICQPPDAAKFRRGDAAKPHIEVRLARLRQDPQILVVEVVAVMRQVPLGPGAAQHSECLVEELGAGTAFDTECLLLVRVGDAKSEGRQEAAVRQAVQRRQLLGEDDGIAAGQHHHTHPELQLGRAAGGEGHADQWVRSVATDPLAQPQAVEAQPLECVDDHCESVVVEARARSERVADANVWRATHSAAEAGGVVQLAGLSSTRRRATRRAPEESIVTNPSPDRDTTVNRCCEPTRAGVSWMRCQPRSEATTMIPTTITGSGTCPASSPATSAATAPAFNANRVKEAREGAGVRCMAFTFI